MGESQLSRLAGLLQLSKHHRESWKAMQRRSATGNSLRDTSMDMEAQPRQRMLRTSGRMNLGTALSVMGSFVLLIAFCSSHWWVNFSLFLNLNVKIDAPKVFSV